MSFETPNALQIRITLQEIEPAIWRRLVVPWAWNLRQLHLAIQAAFNWQNYHLHEFQIGGLRFGDTEIDDEAMDYGARLFDERGVRLLDFTRRSRPSFIYSYDFGDGWEHRVEIEEDMTLPVPPRAATCLEGARACPPEDVGGPIGYERFLEIMADADNPEHAEMKAWCGGRFDPEWFDLALADKYVKNAMRPSIRRRVGQPKPKG